MYNKLNVCVCECKIIFKTIFNNFSPTLYHNVYKERHETKSTVKVLEHRNFDK